MNEMKGGALFGIKDTAKLRLIKLGWRMKSHGKNMRLGLRSVCVVGMGVDDFCSRAFGTVGVMAL